MRLVHQRLKRLLSDDRGATAVEYGVMLALVSIFIMVGVTNVGGALKSDFNNVANKLP